MFSRMKWTGLLSMILLFTLVLGASAQEAERTGAWVDEVVLIEVPQAEQAISRLLAGDIDLYAYSVSNAALFEQVQANPNLDYYTSFGSYSELSFNTVPTFEDGRLNPFGSARFREAMNWVVDRDYIAQEIYGGLAVPKFTVLTRAFADYARVVEKMRELETKYAYNFEMAQQVVAEEMTAMGAEMINGKWHHNDQPIVLTVIARIEDERRQIGAYFANQLEALGFTAIVEEKTSAEASPIWLTGDPNLGRWHVYTGGWSSPVVYRDQTHNFEQMYTPRIMGAPGFDMLKPDPELDTISQKLYNKDFSTMEERNALLERILELGFQDSARIFLVDRQSFVPRRKEITVASDLGGQVAGTLLWAPTLRRGEEIGGRVVIAQPSILNDPWNPIEGSNTLYDQMPIRATMERSIITDPYTGNYWANRIERAEVYAKKGLPIAKSLDWVDLHFVEEDIVVPGDAWVDWDAEEQRFITVAEKFPEGLTALRRSLVYYPEDFYETVKWHDGSPISVADVVFWYIIGFDRGKPESAIHDRIAEEELARDLPMIKGMRIVSTDPLVIESWSDVWYLDAEFMYGEYFPVDINQGPGGWHNIGLGILAEANRELAFSAAKAADLEVDWMSFHTGPSVEIMAKYLTQAQAEGYLPYANTLSKYVTPGEVEQRWNNLAQWYAERNHFWLGTGVMYLDRVYPVERMIVLKRFEDHPDPAGRWDMFGEPRIPEVEILTTGRTQVKRGTEAAVDVAITYAGEPYDNDQLVEVSYLIQDSRGAVVGKGVATPVEDGLYRISLTADDTRALPIGSTSLTAIVVSQLVGGAQFDEVTFVTTP